MARTTALTIELTTGERCELEATTRSTTMRAGFVKHCRILLLRADDLCPSVVKNMLFAFFHEWIAQKVPQQNRGHQTRLPNEYVR